MFMKKYNAWKYLKCLQPHVNLDILEKRMMELLRDDVIVKGIKLSQASRKDFLMKPKTIIASFKDNKNVKHTLQICTFESSKFNSFRKLVFGLRVRATVSDILVDDLTIINKSNNKYVSPLFVVRNEP